MKVRIQNDGKPGYMTRVTDVETDEVLEHVTHVDINIDVREVLTAKITTLFPVVDVIADAEIKQVCPGCGKPVEQKVEVEESEESFDAIAFFAKLDEVVYLQDVKRWITEELARPLEEVAGIEIDTPPLFTGVTEEGWKTFQPGRIMAFAVRFHNGDVRYKAINLDDYDAPLPLQGNVPEQLV